MSLPPPPPAPVPPSIPPPPGREPEAIPSVPDARPSRAPLAIGILLVVAFFGDGALLWSWATRPALCHDANVTSERFGYCITAPPGWRWPSRSAGELPADQLIRLDGDTTLMIQAVETGRDLPAYADDVRRLQTDNGLHTEEMRSLTVAGVDALEWDATLAIVRRRSGRGRSCSSATASRGGSSSPIRRRRSTHMSAISRRCSGRGGSAELRRSPGTMNDL